MRLLDQTSNEGNGSLASDVEQLTVHESSSNSPSSTTETARPVGSSANTAMAAAFAGAARGDASPKPTAAAESSSRPPSPPDSGTTTPRLRIPPCPPRLTSLIPPPNYGTVSYKTIYRGAFPADRNIGFLKKLSIKHILKLVTTERNAGYDQWIKDSHVQYAEVDIAANKDGRVKTSPDSLCQALLFMLDSSHYPLLVHCNQGRHRTGCVVACLRRIQRWPLADILDEYHTYASPKARDADIELITNFDPNIVFHYAKRHGYFDGPDDSAAPSFLDGTISSNNHHRLRLRRLDSAIVNIDMLAEALQAGALSDSFISDDVVESVVSVSIHNSSVASDDDDDDDDDGIQMSAFRFCREHAQRQQQSEQLQLDGSVQSAEDGSSSVYGLADRTRAARSAGSTDSMDVYITELDDDVMSP